MKLFSVVVCVYNNCKYLEDCLDSVLLQDYPAIELIVCDDCSQSFDVDYFCNYIEQHKKDNIKSYMVYQNEQNYGTVRNLNIALGKAQGEYFKDIAADDALYDESVLSNIVHKLTNSSDGIVVCDMMNCDKNMHEIGIWKNDFNKRLGDITSQEAFCALTIRNKIAAGGIFFNKKFWDMYGPYDERFRLLEDWPTWLRFFAKGGQMLYIPMVVVKYRTSGGVISTGNPDYLKDRENIVSLVIKPNRHLVSFWQYSKACVAAVFATNSIIRKIYYLLR